MRQGDDVVLESETRSAVGATRWIGAAGTRRRFMALAALGAAFGGEGSRLGPEGLALRTELPDLRRTRAA